MFTLVQISVIVGIFSIWSCFMLVCFAFASCRLHGLLDSLDVANGAAWNSWKAYFKLLQNASVVGFVLLYCFFSEKSPLFAHDSKIVDADTFWFFNLGFLLLSAFTVRRVEGSSTVLNRNQVLFTCPAHGNLISI